MKYLILTLLILSFNSFSYDEELEGYTFQADFESKDGERTVANRKAKSFEGDGWKKSKDKKKPEGEDERVKPDYWEWTEKVE